MIRPIIPADQAELIRLTESTGYFQPHEIDTLQEVLAEYFRESQELGHRCFLLEENGQILGYVYHAPEEMTKGTWTIWWIAVRPESQGQGIGSRLVAFAETDSLEQGAQRLFIETSSQPLYESTRHFYLKLGYSEVARVPSYYAAGDDKLYYCRNL